MSKKVKQEKQDIKKINKKIEEGDIFLEGKSIDEIINKEEKKNQQNNNYLAIIILLIGFLIGSLFIDVAQLLSKKGYSARALRQASIFSLDKKTWVAYEEPIVKVTILSVSKDELEKCPTCQPPKEVVDLFKKVMPTLIIKEVERTSEEGKKIIAKNNIKALPAMIFSDELEKTEFYKGEAKVLFTKNDISNNYLLSLIGLGLPVGKYIETPTIDNSNPIIGNKNAKIRIILFSDHQCPYCAKFFNDVVKVSKKFGEKVVLVYKDLPLDFHSQAMNAAIAGECAKDQNKFWEMSKELYATQKYWDKLEDNQAKDFFKKQAAKLRLDINKFNKCLAEDRHKEEIESSKKQAELFGIVGTPGVFINDEFIGGVIPAEQLQTVIQAKLNELGN